MKKASLLAAALVLFFSGCGKKGAILPPLASVPQPPEILSLVQQGDQAVVEWKNPELYADGRPLPGLASVEIWSAEAGAKEPPEPAGLVQVRFQERAALQAVVRQAEFANLQRRRHAGRAVAHQLATGAGCPESQDVRLCPPGDRHSEEEVTLLRNPHSPTEAPSSSSLEPKG